MGATPDPGAWCSHDPQKNEVRARLQGVLKRMPPEDRKRAIEAAKARLELIHHACQAGLSVETPEQIQAALGRIRESIEREARSDG
jgi:hypothetical protein